MTLVPIAAFALILLATRVFPRWRGWMLFAASALAVFWLQPPLPVRGLDFWLPAATLSLAAAGWLVTRPRTGASPAGVAGRRGRPDDAAARSEKTAAPRPPCRWGEDGVSALLLAAVVLLAGLTRYLGPEPTLTASRPPPLPAVLGGVGLLAALLLALAWLTRAREPGEGRNTPGPRRRDAAGEHMAGRLILLLLAILVILKSPALAATASTGLRALAGQNPALAAPLDLRWLGFSYLAFRLIHTARDRQSGRLPALSLREYLTYALFFPALTAGPIDRAERFLKDLRAGLPAWRDEAAATQLGQAGRRLALGLFKKFVLAAGLALVALDAPSAALVRGAGWAWLLVYAYALMIYFDFSGYTDIAIGLGLLAGVKLPENFNAPYLKPNLTQFWNNWHMTLTQWFRAYYFNPVTRALRATPPRVTPLGATAGANPQAITPGKTGAGRVAPTVSAPVIIFITQVSTMLLIGLWHGITWNFVLWGAWHGLGLFVHNRWSEFARARWPGPQPRALAVLGTLFTFHYVAVGWVFFALPTPELAGRVLRILVGG